MPHRRETLPQFTSHNTCLPLTSRMHLHVVQMSRMHLHVVQMSRMHLPVVQMSRMHLPVVQISRLHLHVVQMSGVLEAMLAHLRSRGIRQNIANKYAIRAHRFQRQRVLRTNKLDSEAKRTWHTSVGRRSDWWEGEEGEG
jgi:hypothetical protein